MASASAQALHDAASPIHRNLEFWNRVRYYEDYFTKRRRALNQRKNNVMRLQLYQQKYYAELRRQGYSDAMLADTTCLLESLKTTVRRLDGGSRLESLMLTFHADDPEVVGKISSLACIEDDNMARIISWHLGNSMDCVATVTTAKASEISDLYQGYHEVLPLDTAEAVYFDWNKPMPLHLLGGCPGEPAYARNYLKFPSNSYWCKLAFGLLLGDTVVVNTMVDARIFRAKVMNISPYCPTILTRDGRRLIASGQYGGSHNSAPELNNLLGAVFAKHPLPNDIALQYKIPMGCLTTYNSVLRSLPGAVSSLRAALACFHTEEYRTMEREYRELLRGQRFLDALLMSLLPVGAHLAEMALLMSNSQSESPPESVAEEDADNSGSANGCDPPSLV